MKKQKKNNTLFYLIAFSVGLLLVAYISLLAGAYVLNSEEEVVLISAFLMFPDLIQANPFAITPINKDALTFGIMIYVIACGFYYISVEMNKNTMPGQEYGSSRFMNHEEIKDYRKKYMDKQVYTEGLLNGGVTHGKDK